MSITAEEVVVKLRAELAEYDRRVAGSTRLSELAFDKIGNASAAAEARVHQNAVRMEADMRKSTTAISGQLGRLAGSIAAYFSGRELVGLINGFTTFQNKLRVAGIAGSELKQVQDQLFESAQRYGVELGALGGLYGSLASASKELGVSQQQIFQLTDTVAASLKISGLSANEASGALLQLGQALRGGKIRAEEFNSLLDGMFPLLEAVAAGSDRWGGSIAKLTRDVKDGKVASAEFFDAALKGSEAIKKRAAESITTVSEAVTKLRNALTVYVGEAAQSSGTQAALAQGIEKIAQNLDTLIPALALVAGALGVKYVAGAAAATLATIRTDAALLGLTTRAEVAGFAIGTLARALAINGVVLALTAAIGGLGAEFATNAALTQSINTKYDEMRKRLEAAGKMAKDASDGSKGVGNAASTAEPKVRSFAGAVGELADQLYRQAQAARAAKLEMLDKRLKESQAEEVEAGRRTSAGRNAEAANLRRGGIFNLRNWPVIRRAAQGDLENWWTEGASDREADERYRMAVRISRDLQRELREARAAPLTDFVDRPMSGAGGTSGDGKRKGGSKSSGKTADQIREEQQRIEAQIANARIAYLQEVANATRNMEERAKLEAEIIEATRQANETEIKNDERLSQAKFAAERAELLAINDMIAAIRAGVVQEQLAEELRAQQLDITRDALRDEDAMLQIQAGLARTAEDRRKIERRRLDIAYSLERAEIAEDLLQAQIAGDTKRIAAARKRLADLEERKTAEEGAVDRANLSPGKRYLDELTMSAAELNEALEAVQVRGLQGLSDGIAEAISQGKSLGEVFKNVANSIIADLLRIAIQQAIIKPLANSLFGGGGGLFGLKLPFFATGTSYAPGGLAVVGERGRELVNLPRGSQVIPNNNLPSGVMRAGGGAGPVSGTISLELTDDLNARIVSVSGPIAVEINRALQPETVSKSVAETFRQSRRPRP